VRGPDDRVAARLVQEVADRAPSAPEWSDVLARLAPEASPAPRSASRRPWMLVAAAGGVAAAAALGTLVYQRAGTDGDLVTASTAPPVSATDAPDTTSAEASRPGNSATAVFAPSAVPDGFAVVEAGTWDGSWPYSSTRVSTETWISSGVDGSVDGYVRLTANAAADLPNLMPPTPTGVTVHGAVAQADAALGPDGGGAVHWDEQGMRLSVSSWGPDAVSIAEQSVVTASGGIALPAGALPATFVRAQTEATPAPVTGRSSEVRWATADGRTLGLSARPNSTGETVDTLGSTPGARRVAAGSNEVWLWRAGDVTSATWLQGDHVVSAGGNVDEAALLEFVASVGRTSEPAFQALILEASALDQAIAARDRATFVDGVEVSMHSDAAIDVPEPSSFGPRSFCATGDRTFCTAEVTPFTDGGLLTGLVGSQTIDGEHQVLVWLGPGRTMTRVYDANTNADLDVTTAPGLSGSFARAVAPAGAATIVVEYQVPGRWYRDTLRANLGVADPLADVRAPNPQAG
jgi:hypothetical protein